MKKKLFLIPFLSLIMLVMLSGCFETRHDYYQRNPYSYHHHDRDYNRHHNDRDDNRHHNDRDDYGYRRH